VRAVGQGFFAEKYFKEVLLRDRDVAGAFQAQRRRPPRLRSLLLAAAGLCMLVLAAGFVVSFFGNRALVAEAAERGARVDAITREKVGKGRADREDLAAARVEIEAVEQLREVLEELDAYERNSPPLRLRFGLYSGGDINPSLRTIYFDAVEQRFKRPAVAALERDLRAFASGVASAPTRAAASGGSPAADAPEDVLGRNYDLLKAYLMLADASKVEPRPSDGPRNHTARLAIP
jgi:type VI secretion system protein ImpL